VAATWPAYYHRRVPKPIVVGVDDDRRVRESLESLIASAGYAALVFASADEFLRSGQVADADCVIADVRMPGIDGVELLRRLRIERPYLPVIFISAHYEDHVRRQALEGGAIDFLYKPFDAADLLSAIDRALRKQ
jgi:FixJ family two-component response regulator